jgi:carboxylesterase type B
VQVQVGHELLSGGQPIIRRAIQYSNAIPSQPKSVSESQAAFDGLLKACGIPLDLDSKEKMLRLRALPMETLRDLIMSLDIHTFRAVTDGAFISPNLHGSLADGSFAAAFARRNMSLVVGEVSHEELLYGATNPPKGPDALATELANYYPAEQVGKLLAAFDVRTPPSDPVALRAVFGDMVATGQVYAPVRALVRALLTAVPANKVLRYRVAWQPGELDAASIWDGVTHADDLPLWWCLIRLFGREDDAPVRAWLEPLQAFMDGKDASAEWYDGQKPEGTWLREIRDGKIAVVKDDKWTRCLEVADAIAV